MKFLNLFKKSNQKENEFQQEEPQILSSVTYSMDQNGEMFVDINIAETNEENLRSLSSLLVTVATTKSSLTVLDMIKKSLVDSGHAEEYLTFLTDYMTKTDILFEELGEKTKEEPYIKPSEMI